MKTTDTKEKFSDLLQKTAEVGKKTADFGKKAAEKTVDTAITVAGKTKNLAGKSQTAVLNAIDQNGNGEVDIEDVIIIGLRVPGIRINRDTFLQKELQTKFPQSVIDDAIARNVMDSVSGLKILDSSFFSAEYKVAVVSEDAKKQTKIVDAVNELIDDGTAQGIIDKYMEY